MKLRKEVLWFARQMEAKLIENDHKGHWSNEDEEYLLRRLTEERRELGRAVGAMNWVRPTPEQIRAVIREAADVANFAMMLADMVKKIDEEFG